MKLGLGALLLALALRVGAAEDGGQPLAFSKQAVGARAAALGRATGALGGDAYGQMENPALIATLTQLRIGSQWGVLPTGRSQQYLGMARPVEAGSQSVYALAYDRSASETPIEKRRSNTPDPDALFSDSAYIFDVSYGSWLLPQRLAAGVSVKVLGQSLGEASSGGFSGDFGLLYLPLTDLALGLDLQDFASKLTWNSGYAETLPLLMRGSFAWKLLDQRLLLLGEIEKSTVQEVHLHTGLEWWALPQALALRLGWAQGLWAIGLGLRTKGFGWSSLFGLKAEAGLDYALAADPLGDAAFQHRFSLDFGFSLENP